MDWKETRLHLPQGHRPIPKAAQVLMWFHLVSFLMSSFHMLFQTGFGTSFCTLLKYSYSCLTKIFMLRYILEIAYTGLFKLFLLLLLIVGLLLMSPTAARCIFEQKETKKLLQIQVFWFGQRNQEGFYAQ